MEEIRLGLVVSHFADIVWQNEPIITKNLVEMYCHISLVKLQFS